MCVRWVLCCVVPVCARTCEFAHEPATHALPSGQSYGGLPDGETILHLAVREDNSHYPNRFEVGMAISECGADFTVRNSVGKTPRDLNKLLVDALWPMHHWKNKHVLAWMESRGHALRYLPQWKMLFEVSQWE